LISGHIRRIRPQVVITFGPEGVYGHPDHIGISQFTSAAIVRAATPDDRDESPPYTVSKLYYMAETQTALETYQGLSGELVMEVDGKERGIVGWPEWALTTHIDTRDHWTQVLRAIRCHRTQIPSFEQVLEASDETQRELWGIQSFYRAYSLVNGGRGLETDLFAGLR
jgi:LmbE family N-acetylglucosaminyl deacetylase